MKIFEDGIQREATAEEIAAFKQTQKEVAEQIRIEADQQAAKAAARQAVLAKLGLTADEAAALFG